MEAFSKIARGWVLWQMEPYDKRYPSYGKESLFAYPWGLKFIVVFGQLVRSIMNPLKIKFTQTDKFPFFRADLPNPWTDEEGRWFVFRSKIPLPCVFISIVLWNNWGFYFGSKLYTVSKSSDNPRYGWADISEHGCVYQCPSGSVRKSAID